MRIATVLVSMVLLGSVAAQDTVINIDGAPYSIMLCHGNAMDTSFLFIDSNAVESIALRFCGGTLEEFADEVRVYDGSNDTAPLLYMGSGAFGQMADVLVIATSPAIYLEVITNDSLSCADQAFEALTAVAFPVSMGLQDCQFAGMQGSAKGPVRLIGCNAVEGELRIDRPVEWANARFEVIDAAGRMVRAVEGSGSQILMDVGGLAPSRYFLRGSCPGHAARVEPFAIVR